MLERHIAAKGEAAPGLVNRGGRNVTVRIDSALLEEAELREESETASDAAERIREVVATVGKLGQPGEQVRCIISVAMLSEGWDARNVTQILGVRAFQSQLLCEQVVGRGLRRASYELTENGTFTEEVAKILGVPFEVVPFKQSKAGKPPKVRQHHVQALSEKAEYGIEFPRVEGYQQAIRNRVRVDWDAIASVSVDPMNIPDEVRVKADLLLNKGRPTIYGPGAIDTLTLERWRKERRLQEREFEMAARLTKEYVDQPTCEAPAHVLFPQLLAIVQRFEREKIVVDAPEKRIDAFLAPYWGYVIERLTQAVRPDTSDGEPPEVPRYETGRERGSTADVDFWTSKPVKEVVRSHLNYVVADTRQWEQAAAYHIDGHPKVAAFVKNQSLGFAIPYLHNGQAHDYLPDFIVRLDNGVRLILETKGHDELEEVKAQAARRWVDAVNADGSFGEWRYVLTHDINAIPDLLMEP